MARGRQTLAAAAVASLVALGLFAACDKTRRPPELPAPTAPSAPIAPPIPRSAPMPPGFLKGQLHAHTSRSADCTTAPEDVHRWYEARGFDFVVFTDHNVITDTPDTAMLTFPGVELTQNPKPCTPPPPEGKTCALHMNALLLSPDAGAQLSASAHTSRIEVYAEELATAKALGGIGMLNHPNLASGADADTIFALTERGLTLLEVANLAWDSENAGDATRPSTEALWDAVLSRGARLFATVTDDAHSYDDAAARIARGERPFVGDLGFVVVRAGKDADAIRTALARGDFYGSSGLIFSEVELGPRAISLSPRGGQPARFDVIGRGGRVLRRERTAHLRLALTPSAGDYVRVRATADDGSFALMQPVFGATLK